MNKQLLITSNIEFGKRWKNHDKENRTVYLPESDNDVEIASPLRGKRYEKVYVDMSIDTVGSEAIAKVCKYLAGISDNVSMIASSYDTTTILSRILDNMSTYCERRVGIVKFHLDSEEPTLELWAAANNDVIRNIHLPLTIPEPAFTVGDFVISDYFNGRICKITQIEEGKSAKLKCMVPIFPNSDRGSVIMVSAPISSLLKVKTVSLHPSLDRVQCCIVKSGIGHHTIGIVESKICPRDSQEMYTIIGDGDNLYMEGKNLTFIDVPSNVANDIFKSITLCNYPD